MVLWWVGYNYIFLVRLMFFDVYEYEMDYYYCDFMLGDIIIGGNLN